jgi:hypothetical protein
VLSQLPRFPKNEDRILETLRLFQRIPKANKKGYRERNIYTKSRLGQSKIQKIKTEAPYSFHSHPNPADGSFPFTPLNAKRAPKDNCKTGKEIPEDPETWPVLSLLWKIEIVLNPLRRSNPSPLLRAVLTSRPSSLVGRRQVRYCADDKLGMNHMTLRLEISAQSCVV